MNYETPTNNFTVIDNNYRNLELTTQEKLLYITLCTYYNNEKGFAYPSYADLRKACSIGDNRTLIKCIESLVNNGLLTKETIKGTGCKYYPINVYLVENPTTCKNTLSVELHQHLVENPTTYLVENSTTINTITNTNINTNTDTGQDTNENTNQDADMAEKLWSLYPNKQGKSQAIKKIPKLIEQHGYEKIETCIKRYSEVVKGRDRKYIKYGSTFFNGGYMDYLDENVSELSGSEKKLHLDQYSDMYYYLDGDNRVYVSADEKE